MIKDYSSPLSKIMVARDAPEMPQTNQSEVIDRMQELMNKISLLRCTIDDFEVRLKPVLPEAQMKREAPKENPQRGNFCPISRTLEDATIGVDDAVMHLRVIMEEIRI